MSLVIFFFSSREIWRQNSQRSLQSLLIMIRTGWPADLEFLETWKSQIILWYLKKVREFHEIRKSQGILLARNKYGRSLFKIHSSLFKWWTRVGHACSYITYAHQLLSQINNEFKLRSNLSFLFGSKSVLLLIKLYYICRDEFFRF